MLTADNAAASFLILMWVCYEYSASSLLSAELQGSQSLYTDTAETRESHNNSTTFITLYINVT